MRYNESIAEKWEETMTSPSIDVVEDVLEKLQKLRPEKQQQVLAFVEFLLWQQTQSKQPPISVEVASSTPKFPIQSEVELLDGESQAWLEAELVSDGDEYEWGEAGIPVGKVVQCVPGQGAVIVGADGGGT